MLKVGLTGGIATGKSYVLTVLSELGCEVIDADTIAHQVIEPNRPAYLDIVNRFGNEILNEDGTINRAALGAIGTKKGVSSVWYTLLRKSKLQPSRKAFGPVWTGLYALIAVSGYRVWAKPKSRARSQALALWGAQLGLNGAWTWIFFGARKPVPALAEIGVLAGSIALYMRSARRVDPLASTLVVPYLGWVGFASLLNGAVVRKNPKLAL